jgi:hypothetical protein
VILCSRFKTTDLFFTQVRSVIPTVVLPQEHSGPSLLLALARLVEVLARSEVEEQQVCSVNQPPIPLLRPHLSSVNPQRRQAQQVHLVARIPSLAAVTNLGQVRLSFFILDE